MARSRKQRERVVRDVDKSMVEAVSQEAHEVPEGEPPQIFRQDGLKLTFKPMLKVLSEKRQGSLMPISSSEWQYVEAVLDSGATVIVIPAHVGQGYDITPSAASKAGVYKR